MERQRILLVSPNIQDEKSPRRAAYSSVTDGYALSLCALPGHYAAAIAAPSSYVIDVLDKTTLVRVQTLPGHDIGTTSLRTVNGLGGGAEKCLVSSGRDGSIMAWDLRANLHSIKSKGTFCSGCPNVLTTHKDFGSDQFRQKASIALL